MKKHVARQPFVRLLFVIYCIVMLWLLFGRTFGWEDGLTYRQMLEKNINIVPLYTIKNYLRVVIYKTNDALFIHCLINLLGNILLFIPCGYLLPKLWNKQRNFFIFLLFVILSLLVIETAQLFTLLGSCDIDDIILNVLGMIVGYLFWVIFK